MCGTTTPDDNQRFCPNCGSEMVSVTAAKSVSKKRDANESDATPMVGDKNLINDSTIIGKQEKYEASNITINNTITEDHSHTTVVCAVSGKRVYMDNSIVCPQCSKPVAPEYYIEATKRCENCEHKAEEAFRDFAVQTLQGKSLNAGTKGVLDSKGAELLLTPEKQTEILRSVQKASTVKESVLSKMQQVELERAVKRFVQAESEDDCRAAYEVFELLHNTTQNYVADFWYFMTSAITDARKYINTYEGEVVENFWQSYWSFMAYCYAGSPKSSTAIDALRKSFAEHEADINLAEVVYLLRCGYGSHDMQMLKQAKEALPQINADELSKPLMFIYEIVAQVLQEGLSRDLAYPYKHRFVLLRLVTADKFLQYVNSVEEQERIAEQKRLAEEERQRQAAEAQKRHEAEEQKRREQQAREQAERERRAEQQRIVAEQNAKMQAEMSRLGVNDKEPKKDFVGYETTLPKSKKWGCGKILLTVFLGLLFIALVIGVLFLIPAPESMQ